MNRSLRSLCCAVTAGVVAAMILTTAAAAPTAPKQGTPGRPSTFAVIGDIPYGSAEIAGFPWAVAQINADPAVSWVAHLGDIKDGSSVCGDAYFRMIKAEFDRFRDPLVYTVGDNEWTDCHRPTNGSYNPLERLTAVRTTFFSRPGWTLGQRPTRVHSQAEAGYPEDVRFRRDGIAFASVHIVGSNNSLAPWTGNTSATPEQTAEVLGRTADTIAVIRETFAAARAHRDRAVVVMTQADMFDPTVASPSFSGSYAFQPIVAALAQETTRYGRPVYLLNGDSHVYTGDYPLAAGSRWLSFYGLTEPVGNLNRITVDGSANADNYLRVTTTTNRRQPLTWQRVPFTR